MSAGGLEIIAGIAGLLTFAQKLASLLCGLRNSRIHTTEYIKRIQNLHRVLLKVAAEYGADANATDSSWYPQFSFIDHAVRKKTPDLNNGEPDPEWLSCETAEILRSCLISLFETCNEYETLLTRIKETSWGRVIRALRWKLAAGDVVALSSRLRSDMSTLSLLIQTMR